MIKTQINLRSYLALSLGYLLLTTVSASAQTKQEIVEAWQQQVNSFQTLQLDYDVASHDLTAPFGKDALLALKHKFALSGDKYYSYLTWPGNTVEGFSAMASTYNGDYSQKLQEEKGKVTVYKSKKQDESEHPYLSPHPLTIQYQFAFTPDASRSIGTLKKSETWERLAERILAIRPSTRNGRQELTVDIKIPQSTKIYRVLVDEKSLWPHHWSVIIQDDGALDNVVEEMAVNTITPVGEKDTALKFPTQIILRALSNGRLLHQAHVSTVPKSLKINEPVPDDIFTLSPQNATFVDADERERIYEEKRDSTAAKRKQEPKD